MGVRAERQRRRRQQRRLQRLVGTAAFAASAVLLLAFALPEAPGLRTAAEADDFPAPPAAVEASPTPGAAAALPVQLPAGPVTVAATGDIHAEPPIRAQLLAGQNPLEELVGVLSGTDLTVVNVETAVGEQGTPADKQYTFQAPTELWSALVASGVDVVTLANNHALDYGRDALLETVAGARAAGLLVVGAGADAQEAYAPAFVDVRGERVAVVGLTRVMPELGWGAAPGRPGLASAYDEEAAVAAVEAAAAQADHVVVAVHWGDERADCPDADQDRLATAFAAAGADLVVGHHPHVLQGFEQQGDTAVAYSLGNFLWYAKGGLGAQSGVLSAELRRDAPTAAALLPATIGGDGNPRPATPDAAQEALDRVERLAPGNGVCP